VKHYEGREKIKVVRVFIVIALIFVWSQMALAEQESITLPKGTKVEKIGPGHFKFRLPNKQVVEVKNFNPKTGIIGYIGIIDPDPPHKPVASGKQGNLRTTKKLTKGEVSKLSPADYVMIDDDPTWLPVTITYQPAAIIDPQPPGHPAEKGKIKELSPQPDPPGRK